ncbi:hypothetical protein GGX14DRAFT_370161 [Mycena pura]|uniref:Uncharacterized protein n=1 Tax=Mycena pura TaxID=153505 RepID=A0AAD6V4W2_9AGAR|nr:hypothetical protein GGX14DRAFT_370161 [Mycena pura]
MKYASRKYIDLIHGVTAKWASWDPPHPITVGDYGTIDKETGRFEVDGNIYDDPVTAALAAAHPPAPAPPDETLVITAETEGGCDFSLGPEVSIPGVLDASIKGRWQFRSGKTGALLVVSQPRSTRLPAANALIADLRDVPALRDKYIVTETVACHAYSMYLSSKSQDAVSLALVASVPVLAAPGLAAGGSASGAWWTSTGRGVFRSGCAAPETPHFTPLFALKRARARAGLRFRGARPVPDEDDDACDPCKDEDMQLPWAPLDEDGEEAYEEEVGHILRPARCDETAE